MTNHSVNRQHAMFNMFRVIAPLTIFSAGIIPDGKIVKGGYEGYMEKCAQEKRV